MPSLARAALTALLLSLFALPARADLAFPSDCIGKKEGDACQDMYSRGQPGQCRHLKCGYVTDEDSHYDCFQCTTQQQFHEMRGGNRVATAARLRWGLGLLGAGCIATLVWYQWRRRPKAASKASSPKGGRS